MKLITKTVEKLLPKIGSTQNDQDPICKVKFFNPTGAGTWFAIEYDPDTKIAYGYVSIFGDWNDELGDFSIGELEEFKGQFGLGIERDIHFTPTPLSQIKKEYTR